MIKLKYRIGFLKDLTYDLLAWEKQYNNNLNFEFILSNYELTFNEIIVKFKNKKI